MGNSRQDVLKSVIGDIVLLIMIAVYWFVMSQSPVADHMVSASTSYTLRDLFWLSTSAMIGVILFDIGDRVTPLLALVAERKYAGKRILYWNELTKTATRVIILAVVWWVLSSQTESLIVALNSWISPALGTTLEESYHALFGLAIAYCIALGAIRGRSIKSGEAKPLSEVYWSAADEAARISDYLKRLEALKSSGHLDERTYDKLRAEYESKLKASIEQVR